MAHGNLEKQLGLAGEIDVSIHDAYLLVSYYLAEIFYIFFDFRLKLKDY